MSFALYELAVNQELQKRAREEIAEVLRRFDGGFCYEAVKEMKFLGQIIDGGLEGQFEAFVTSLVFRDVEEVPGCRVSEQKVHANL